MVYSDMKQKEIAQEIKVSEQSISNWKKNEEFRAAVEKETRTALRDFSTEAVKTLGKLLKTGDDRAKLGAANSILDRTGFKPKNEVEVSGLEKEKSKLDALIEQMRGDD